ncbi:peptidyl-prolyl cis-trans isomerase CYP21-4 [Curcuma longa]|uniref:peptidyl-prolyl cis-trans isomerase CYP21-4 n=1 Tax=Curcuma longa TaxID=136217 RepID=UPI003D9F01FC
MAKIKPQALLLQSKKKKAPSRISLSTIITCNIIIVLVILSLYATYRHWHYRLSNGIGTGMEDIEHLETFEESTRSGLPNYAILLTGKGPITIELDKDSSRDVVDKFVNLCQKGYFKGMLFNHVIKNYIIQGGHSQKAGAAEEWILKGKLQHQLATSAKHETFILGTGKPTKDNKEFELFITTAAISDLNDKLIFFGRVIKGEEVVQEIEKVDTDQHYQPKSPMGITNVILKQEA